MKSLAQYLAEYIDRELDDDNVLIEDYQDFIEHAIGAFQSTENCTITITVNPTRGTGGLRMKYGTFNCGKYHQCIKSKPSPIFMNLAAGGTYVVQILRKL